MPDLLIRNMTPELKRRLAERARRDRRSLSEEAKLLLNRGLGKETSEKPVGTALVELFRDAAIEFDNPARTAQRAPPEFE